MWIEFADDSNLHNAVDNRPGGGDTNAYHRGQYLARPLHAVLWGAGVG